MKSLKVHIAGREYPLKVTEEEELLVLRAVEDVQKKLQEYQSLYRTKDKQDHLAMALLTYAVEHARSEANEDLIASIGTKADALLFALNSAD